MEEEGDEEGDGENFVLLPDTHKRHILNLYIYVQKKKEEKRNKRNGKKIK